jgi:hypothetical protein
VSVRRRAVRERVTRERVRAAAQAAFDAELGALSRVVNEAIAEGHKSLSPEELKSRMDVARASFVKDEGRVS